VTGCTQTSFEFPPLKRRKVQAEFTGGDITSDGGVLLLRQIDSRLGLLNAVDTVIADPRDPRYIEHSDAWGQSKFTLIPSINGPIAG
jgi:hypothetical protein